MSRSSWADGPAEVELHSQAKHRVLKRYLTRYFEVRCKEPRMDRFRITLVDGFAGGGLYRMPDTGAPWRGSPMIMLDVVREQQAVLAAMREKPFQLDAEFVFVEKVPTHVRFLREQLARELLPGNARVRVHEGDIAERLPDIVAQVRQHTPRARRALFLLDPFSYDGVLPLLKQIMHELPQAEIILTFMADALVNFLSDSQLSRDIVRRNQLEALERALPSLSEMKSEGDWRARIEAILHKDIWRASGARFFTPFFIVSEESNRAYWLVHLSNQARARDVMIQVHWELQNTFEHYGEPGLDMFALGYRPREDEALSAQSRLFQFGARDRERALSALVEDIPRKLALAGRDLTFGEFFEHNCNYTPADMALLRQAAHDCLQAGELEAIMGGEGEVRRSRGGIRDDDRLVLRRQSRFDFGRRGL